MRIFLIQPAAEAAFKTTHIGLQMIATVLREHGYENIHDVSPYKGDDPYSLDYSGDEVIVGITVTFMTISEAFRIARHVKEVNGKALVVFGGPQATLMPDESIDDENVDAVVLGEGEFAMVEIAERVRTGRSLDGVKGVWFKDEKGGVVKNEDRDFLKDLDILPIADRTFFDDRAYWRHQSSLLERAFMPVTWSVMSAYSCPYACKMCQPALKRIAGPWRQRSVGHMIREIKLLKTRYNARHFAFYDNDMGIKRKWMEEFCRETKKIEGIRMKTCVKVNLMDYEMLKLMKEGGFYSLSFGAESGSDRVLKEIMDKRQTVRDIIDLANNCYKLRIRLGAFWMMANPGETVEEMRKTVELASELPIFYCHFHIATPNPGTQYYFDAVNGGYLNMESWDDVNERKKPTILKDGVTPEMVAEVEEYLIRTMLKRGWNYRYSGHTLSFINTRLYARWYPAQVFGNEINMFMHDFKPYHIRNIYLGFKSLAGIDRSIGRFSDGVV